MFATLLGSDTDHRDYRGIFDRLCEIATKHGYVSPDARLPIQPDQTPLQAWSLEFQGPAEGNADFLLAVTAPKSPSISPIPVRNTISAPLFSVIVMDTFLGVWRNADFQEFKDGTQVLTAFEEFLRSIEQPMNVEP